MVDLSEMIRGERPLTVTVEPTPGQRVNLEVMYDPNVYTLEFHDWIVGAPVREVGARYRDAFCQIVKSWNAVWKGEPIPITPERIWKLDFFYIEPVVLAIIGDVRPNS